MAQWPRRVTRGPLKGQTFNSESEYRKAYSSRTGESRYAKRQALARTLGYKGYPERRATLRKIGGDKEAERYLLSQPEQVRKAIADELERFGTETKEQRVRRLLNKSDELGINVHMLYARFYQLVDIRGLR